MPPAEWIDPTKILGVKFVGLSYEEAYGRSAERIVTNPAFTPYVPRYTPEGYIDARRDDGGVPVITTLKGGE